MERVAIGGGTINLAGLSAGGNSPNPPFVVPNAGIVLTGAPGNLDIYTGLTAASPFGPGAGALATSGSGDLVGVAGAADQVGVPQGYVSGTPLSSSATWAGSTIASLGLTPGSYTVTWGSGPTADSFTLNVIGAAAAPEPGSLALLGIAALPLIGIVRRRKG